MFVMCKCSSMSVMYTSMLGNGNQYAKVKYGFKSVVSILFPKRNTEAQVYSRISAQVANFKLKGYVHTGL